MTYLRTRTTSAYLIIVIHINIKHQLSRHGPERRCPPQGLAISWVRAVDWPDLETARVLRYRLFPEQICCREGLIAQVDVAGEGEGEFAVLEVVCRGGGVVKPLKEVAPGEKALVECAHYFGVCKFGGGCGTMVC